MKRQPKLALVAPVPTPPKPVSQFKLKLTAPRYQAVYRPGEPNRCPTCGERSWHVGRITAECAQCDCALPIYETGQ